jgi:hypothetical protein
MSVWSMSTICTTGTIDDPFVDDSTTIDDFPMAVSTIETTSLIDMVEISVINWSNIFIKTPIMWLQKCYQNQPNIL